MYWCIVPIIFFWPRSSSLVTGGFAASWSGGTGFSEVTSSSASLVVLRDANFYSWEDFAHKNSVSCSPVWGGVPWGRVSAERAFILSAGAGTDCLSVCLNGFTPSYPLEIPFWNADFSSPHTLTFFFLLSNNWGLIPAHCSTSRCDSAKQIVFKCSNSLKMRTCRL